MEAHSHSLPPSLNTHSPAELFPNSFVEPRAGDSSTASPIAGKYPYVNLEAAECVTDSNQSAGPSCYPQQSDAACTSTDLKYEIWAKELANDLDKAFTKNSRSALRPGAKGQIEEQLWKGLSLGHFGSSNTPPIIVNAIGAVPKRDSSELRLIIDCIRPLALSANSYMDLDHYKYTTVDEAACKAKPGFWLAKIDLKHAYRSVGTHPSSWKVTGMSWLFQGTTDITYLFYKRLPFGARNSPMVFHLLTQSVCRMMA